MARIVHHNLSRMVVDHLCVVGATTELWLNTPPLDEQGLILPWTERLALRDPMLAANDCTTRIGLAFCLAYGNHYLMSPPP
jgi:hypothetical protein